MYNHAVFKHVLIHLKQEVPIVIVSNKSDLAPKHDLVFKITMKTLKKWGLPFYETSAKSSQNVREVFESIVRLMRRQIHFPLETCGV